jgi:hypothetical protein
MRTQPMAAGARAGCSCFGVTAALQARQSQYVEALGLTRPWKAPPYVAPTALPENLKSLADF